MRHSLAIISCAILMTLPAPSAFATDKVAAEAIKVSRAGDTDLACAQLSKEAAGMRDIILNKQIIQDNSEVKEYGISAAGAVGSFLVGTLTGGIGFAAAGFIASEAVSSEATAADRIQDRAAERRAFMIGIYNAKGCYGPIEHTLYTPPSQTDETRMAAVNPASGPKTPALPKKHYNE